MNYTDRVAKGAAELDRILPGWERKIDLDKLELGSLCTCILGQLSLDLAPIAEISLSYSVGIEAIYPGDLEDWEALED